MGIECACVRLTIHFANDDDGEPTWPGVVKAKVYYKRDPVPSKMTEILECLRLQEKDELDSYLSQVKLKPHPSGGSSLLDFDAIFDDDTELGRRVKVSNVDVKLDMALPIVMIQVSSRLRYGRVTTVTGGLLNDGFKVWQPIWTRTLKNSFQGHADAVVSSLYAPKITDTENNNDYASCDVLRFCFEFDRAEIENNHTVEVEWVQLRVFEPSVSVQTFDQAETPKSSEKLNVGTKPNLPLEIWLKIIAYLPCKISALVALSGTCREWRGMFSHPYFYSTIDLKPVACKFRNAPKEYIVFLVERCRSTIRHLRLSWLPAPPIHFDIVSDFFEKLEQGSLVTLVAENCFAIDDTMLAGLVSNQKNIQLLRIHGCLGISKTGYDSIVVLKQGLKRLSLGDTETINAEVDKCLVRQPCPNLEVVDFSDLVMPDDDDGDDEDIPNSKVNDLASILPDVCLSLAQAFRKLRAVTLDLKFTGYLDYSQERKVQFVKAFLAASPQLEELYLSDEPDYDLNGYVLVEAIFDPWSVNPMSFLANYCPNLRRLSRIVFDPSSYSQTSIGGMPYIDALIKCLAGLNKLERLALVSNECSSRNPEKWNISEILATLSPSLRQLFIWKDDVKAACQPDVLATLQKRYPSCSIEVRRSMNIDEVGDCSECKCGHSELCLDNTILPECEENSNNNSMNTDDASSSS